MTLKEKFDSISCNDCDMPYCDVKCTMLSDCELNKLEQIADDYAIEFLKWCEYKMVFSTSVIHKPTYEKLLEQFKKEKGYE